MNAQTLIDSTETFGNFQVFFKSNSSQVNSFNNFDRGDKFVARKETKHPQVLHKGSTSDPSPHSLMPRTDYLKQININKVKNTATAKADVFRNLGIKFL